MAVACSPLVFGQSAQELVDKHETNKIADLEKYITDNPEAEDLDDAYFYLANSQGATKQFEATTTTLENHYKIQDKSEKANIQKIVQTIVGPYLHATEQTKDKKRALKFLEQMRSDFKSHPEASKVNQFLDKVTQSLSRPEPPSVGETLDISFTATNGAEVDLAKMKGKVVLVDFWATWCGPCVKEMPHVVAAYEKHKAAGFDVIGISLDQEKSKLEAFATENKMTWVQYFDGLGWGNKISGKLGITGIPATFLIGKDGKIVDTNLRGDALDKAIEKALAAE